MIVRFKRTSGLKQGSLKNERWKCLCQRRQAYTSEGCGVCERRESSTAVQCAGDAVRVRLYRRWSAAAGEGHEPELNDCEESAEASQGVRPRPWPCKGGWLQWASLQTG